MLYTACVYLAWSPRCTLYTCTPASVPVFFPSIWTRKWSLQSIYMVDSIVFIWNYKQMQNIQSHILKKQRTQTKANDSFKPKTIKLWNLMYMTTSQNLTLARKKTNRLHQAIWFDNSTTGLKILTRWRQRLNKTSQSRVLHCRGLWHWSSVLQQVKVGNSTEGQPDIFKLVLSPISCFIDS